MKPLLNWTDDCQGKKDYDGHFLEVSTRYWPAGGSFHIFDSRRPELGLHENNDGSPPSAHSSIILRCGPCDHPKFDKWIEGIRLVEKKFEARTQAEVQRQVEQWVQEQFEKAAAALSTAFSAGEPC